MRDKSPSNISWSGQKYLDRVADEFEAAWNRGERPQIERFLEDSADASCSQLLRELLRLDLEYRAREGERPTVADYFGRFPNHASLIESVFLRETPDRDKESTESTAETPDLAGAAPATLSTANWPADGGAPAPGALGDALFDPEVLSHSIGHFDLLALLGQGAFGQVFRAKDRRLDREVALKIPRSGVLATRDDVVHDSTVDWAAGLRYSGWWRHIMGNWTIKEGEYVASVTIDADEAIAERSELDNFLQFRFRSGRPLPLASEARVGAIRRLEGLGAWVHGVDCSADGRYAVTAGHSDFVQLWNVERGREIRRFAGHQGSIESTALSPDGQYVASGGWDRTVRLWDRNTGQELSKFEGHTDIVQRVRFSPDSGRLVSCSKDGTMRIWDIVGKNPPSVLAGHRGSVRSVQFSPDGRFVASCADDKSVRIWDATNAKRSRGGYTLSDNSSSIAFSSTGEQVIAGSDDGVIRLFDAKTLLLADAWQAHVGPVRDIAFLAGDHFVISTGSDATIRIWMTETGTETVRISGEPDDIWGLAVSQDGQFALSSSQAGSTYVWRLPSTEDLQNLAKGDQPIIISKH
jgi:hypothetical protein